MMVESINDTVVKIKLNIVHLITTIERGGAENQLLILCKHQISQGHKVSVYFLKGKPELQSDFEEIGVTVSSRLANKNFLKQILILRATCAHGDTIYHAHLPQAEFVIKFGLSHKKHKCISRHFGGQFHPKIPNLYSVLLSRIITWNIPIIIAPSSYTRKYLYESKELSKRKKIYLAPYGFSKQNFLKHKSTVKEAPVNKPMKLCIGTVGRLSIEKDYPTLLRAFSDVLKVRKDVILKIVGSGPQERELIRMAEDLGISKYVQWLGKISEVAEFMSTLEIFVLASKFEGFGMVLLEAMASELKIIASDAPTCIEVLGVDGVANFFPRGDYKRLSQLILTKLAESNHAFLERDNRLKLYEIKKSGSIIENLYYSLISNKGNTLSCQD